MDVRTLVWLAFALLPLAAGAEVYKYVDENGVVRYTDTPPHPGAQPIRLPEVQTYTTDDIYVREAVPPDSDAVEPEAADGAYASIQLTAPEPEQVYNNANPQVTASVELDPGLRPGHRLVFMVDGTAHPAPPGQTSTVLSGLERGSHSLQALVLDASDRIRAQSESLNFHLSQPSLLQPQSDLMVVPNANSPDYTGDGIPDPIPARPTGPRPPAKPKVPGQGTQ
jgi:hypothetical protein